MLVTSGLFYTIVPSGATLALRVLSSYYYFGSAKDGAAPGEVIPRLTAASP